MIYRAKAPLRLGFGGGGTDVPPYCDQYGGVVLNATINKYAYVTLVPRKDSKININSLDYRQSVSYSSKKKLPYDGNLDLVKAVINRINGFYSCKCSRITGCDLYIRSDAPPGAGLGTSSTVVVAVIGAFAEALRLHLSEYKIAEIACEIERKDMKLQGGKQDQYAATFGGINYMQFMTYGDVVVSTLRVTKQTINELQHNLLLCYTGLTHSSHDVIREQVELSQNRIHHLEHMKAIATAMRDDLLTAKLSRFGELLSTDWHHKKQLSGKITNQFLEQLEAKAMSAGAKGIKITGAGGGGVFIIYCDWDRKTDIANAMLESGCQIMDFTITKTGLETWSVET